MSNEKYPRTERVKNKTIPNTGAYSERYIYIFFCGWGEIRDFFQMGVQIKSGQITHKLNFCPLPYKVTKMPKIRKYVNPPPHSPFLKTLIPLFLF